MDTENNSQPKNLKATRLIRIGFLFLLISFVSGTLNYILTGKNSTFAPLLVISLISFLLCGVLIGFDFVLRWFKDKAGSLNGFFLFIGFFSFLIIFINSPILGNDLNSLFSQILGGVFMLNIFVGLLYNIICSIRENRQNKG